MNSRAARTHQALISAGCDLLLERPIDAIPIDDVVAAAGVAKGSFFNHFADKQAFAQAIVNQIRVELESWIAEANADVSDPLIRFVQGMEISVEFALSDRKRAEVMLRAAPRTTAKDHPLNVRVNGDLGVLVASGVFRPEAEHNGLIFWLGLCQSLTRDILERRLERDIAAHKVREMLILSLSGFGVEPAHVTELAHYGEHAIRDGIFQKIVLEKKRGQ
jgi:AcrR family transcriptional regulator